MSEESGQTINGPQTNISGDTKGPVLSGAFNGPVYIHIHQLQAEDVNQSELVAQNQNSINRGYRLYWDSFIVGVEPDWNAAQAVDNLRWNIQQHPEKRVEGWFNGCKMEVHIGYELYWDGVLVGKEPGYNRIKAVENLKWNRTQYPHKKVEGYFDGEKIHAE